MGLQAEKEGGVNRYRRIGDFHSARAKGVGSSDIPTLALLNKRYGETPLTLWQEKTGRAPRSEAGPRAYWGKVLEGVILAEWVRRHYGDEAAVEYARYKARGLSYGPYKTNTECVHPERSYCLAHADLVVEGLKETGPRVLGGVSDYIAVDVPPLIVEAKSCGLMSGLRREDGDYGYSRKDSSLGGIPMGVFLQVQWQMLCYDIPEAHVAVLIDTGDYREYSGRADPRTQEKLLALAERFWRCVETDTPPKPETWADVQLLWPDTEDASSMVGGETEMKAREMVERYHRLSESAKSIEDERQEIKDALGILMGENKILTTAEGIRLASSWTVASEYASPAKIKEKLPDVYERLASEGLITKSERRDLRPAKLKEE